MSLPDFLSLPRAYGPPPAIGRLRVQPEDFIVREWLGFDADGEGDHLLLRVLKRQANTHWVAKELARRADVPLRDIGFAGIKDRHAVTEQHFTVPARGMEAADWACFTGEGFSVVSAIRHRRKLKRGAHRGNDFRIVVRDVHADEAALNMRLRQIAGEGIPNYFGLQRFGRDGRNLAMAERWFGGGWPPADRLARGFVLSAARSALFNAVLAARVERGTWNQLQEGDVANLEGSGSVFVIDVPDATLRERCERLDIHPTGPLWGGGVPLGGEMIARFERQCIEPWRHWAAGLETAGLEHERRALRLVVHDLCWSRSHANLELSFRLRRGAFATAVLAEITENSEQAIEENEDA